MRNIPKLMEGDSPDELATGHVCKDCGGAIEFDGKWYTCQGCGAREYDIDLIADKDAELVEE